MNKAIEESERAIRAGAEALAAYIRAKKAESVREHIAKKCQARRDRRDDPFGIAHDRRSRELVKATQRVAYLKRLAVVAHVEAATAYDDASEAWGVDSDERQTDEVWG